MPIINNEPNRQQRATDAQTNYIEILCNDIGLSDRLSRNSYLSDIVGREIHYLDQLTKYEAHKVIDKLKAIRDSEE